MDISPKTENILKVLGDLQTEVGYVNKDATNPYFNSKYSTLKSVWDVALPALQKHGLILNQTIQETTLKTRITHLGSGEWIQSTIPLLYKENDMQKLASAITYGRRYSIVTMLSLLQDDDDGNLASKKAEPKKEKGDPEELGTKIVQAKTMTELIQIGDEIKQVYLDDVGMSMLRSLFAEKKEKLK